MNIKKIWNNVIDILSVGCMIGGIVAALWVSLVVMLYGGIVQIIDGLSVEPIVGTMVAAGILKVLFFETGGLLVWIGVLLGIFIEDLKI